MAPLLQDGWFGISALGLIVSGVMFFILLSQYRSAADAADQHEPEAAAQTPSPAVRPVWNPDASSAKVASVSVGKAEEPRAAAPPPAAAPSSAAASKPAAASKAESATGGVSPAVVYLQSIKIQLEELQGDTRLLAKRVDAIAARDEALIERLGELVQAVAELKGAGAAASPAPAPVEAPAVKRPKRAEAAVEPAADPAAAPAIELSSASGVPGAKPKEKTEKADAPASKKDLTVDETVRMGLDDVIAAQLSQITAKKAPVEAAPAPAPAPAAAAPVAEAAPHAAAPAAQAAPPAVEPEPTERKRGPVWPV